MTVVAYSGGGGIYSNDGGSLTIVNSIISGNRAAGGQNPSGGGVAGGSLTIINSTINSNSAVGGFPFTFGDGGGISGGGTITNSTITGNYAGLSGGGIAGGGTISNLRSVTTGPAAARIISLVLEAVFGAAEQLRTVRSVATRCSEAPSKGLAWAVVSLPLEQ